MARKAGAMLIEARCPKCKKPLGIAMGHLVCCCGYNRPTQEERTAMQVAATH